jgi:hypothetical protein
MRTAFEIYKTISRLNNLLLTKTEFAYCQVASQEDIQNSILLFSSSDANGNVQRRPCGLYKKNLMSYLKHPKRQSDLNQAKPVLTLI